LFESANKLLKAARRANIPYKHENVIKRFLLPNLPQNQGDNIAAGIKFINPIVIFEYIGFPRPKSLKITDEKYMMIFIPESY
jgi:hypothetical protein